MRQAKRLQDDLAKVETAMDCSTTMASCNIKILLYHYPFHSLIHFLQFHFPPSLTLSLSTPSSISSISTLPLSPIHSLTHFPHFLFPPSPPFPSLLGSIFFLIFFPPFSSSCCSFPRFYTNKNDVNIKAIN